MNDGLGVVVFYILNILGLLIFVVGSVLGDLTLLSVCIGLIACAFLIKYEFNIAVVFWKKAE
ncbi:hypothetical protein F909_02421 [Acinetobacter sp. ANC 3929]|uniref:hypothetical protein n=1 Tax=unclassified Acinetobacter TaxID=196816 RepID=UPI0002CFB0E3|nr:MULTISPECIES: hypothetical protein [unclassified Acinetobacter]ENW81130.1 hypothetical protein F909_02421 [Acinetobacter sp. ANC 3929]MCH7351295.1 hypothetical protein [Acinetobacter sp. NIPH 2023]MCH7355650.1 hypothetical protein [Acinetobacter sp. NIPH 1958]MCH7358170.1 hypothetical protein [Acinetobacter sp. NIPH 2024]